LRGVRGARKLRVLSAACERRTDRDHVPAGAAVTLTQAESNLSINELRHVYRRKLLALDRRRNDSIEAPRPPFWIRAAALGADPGDRKRRRSQEWRTKSEETSKLTLVPFPGH
jgi:hypothetical protein